MPAVDASLHPPLAQLTALIAPELRVDAMTSAERHERSLAVGQKDDIQDLFDAT